MEIDLIRLGLVVASTFAIGKIFLKRKLLPFSKIYYWGFVAGLLIYSGAAIAISAMPSYYTVYYFGFLVAFCSAFSVFHTVMGPVSAWTAAAYGRGLPWLFRPNTGRAIIFLYVALALVPLVLPSNRLPLLLKPPAPDVVTQFYARFDPAPQNAVVHIANYASLLLTPFFLIALFAYRRRLHFVAIALLVVFYIQYVDIAYKSRGQFMSLLFCATIGAWVLRPEVRKRILIFAAILVPLLSVAFATYEGVREGNLAAIHEWNVGDAAEYLMLSETSYPYEIGLPLMQSGKRVDLAKYAIWIATLPIPKVLTGAIEGARITHEISEVVLGVPRGEHGFYVVLPGLVAESIYIFGTNFFWLHAIFIAFFVALLARMLGAVPRLAFLGASYAFLVAYDLNRSGIGAFLPQVVNQMLAFYTLIFLVGLRSTRVRRGIS